MYTAAEAYDLASKRHEEIVTEKFNHYCECIEELINKAIEQGKFEAHTEIVENNFDIMSRLFDYFEKFGYQLTYHQIGKEYNRSSASVDWHYNATIKWNPTNDSRMEAAQKAADGII